MQLSLWLLFVTITSARIALIEVLWDVKRLPFVREQRHNTNSDPCGVARRGQAVVGQALTVVVRLGQATPDLSLAWPGLARPGQAWCGLI